MSKARTLLVQRHKQLLKKIAPFKAELEEVEAMLKLAEVKAPTVTSAAVNGEKLSIPKQVFVILKENGNGLPTRKLAEEIGKRFGREIKPGNLSWHLSHLKGSHKLVQVGVNWKLP